MATDHQQTRVHLTFDIEVWCDGWSDLDAQFPAAFDRYVHGRSPSGEYALPKTLEILDRHGLTGVFFVEPLFSARFGAEWLDRIVAMISAAGQDIQLHLHPEWTDEIRPPLLADVSRKRQHLVHYSLQEQTELIRVAKSALERSKGAAVDAFRAGSYGANRDTLRALAANGLTIDSSLNVAYHDFTAGSIPELERGGSAFRVEGIAEFPVTAFDDGFGRRRPLQINGTSTREMRAVLDRAHAASVGDVVVVSHNFEMLKSGSSSPDWFVVRRFEGLCRHLRDAADRFDVGAFDASVVASPSEPAGVPSVGRLATLQRMTEQAMRRLA